jgi:hypothetical protein
VGVAIFQRTLSEPACAIIRKGGEEGSVIVGKLIAREGQLQLDFKRKLN